MNVSDRTPLSFFLTPKRRVVTLLLMAKPKRVPELMHSSPLDAVLKSI
jgi:hypothetical protein